MSISGTEKRREEFAGRAASSLSAGVIPWQKKGLPDMPVQSAVSGREYSGLNALYLMEKCAEKGYKDPRFITASEANKHGVYVKKGEHGVVLEHWQKSGDGKIKVRGYAVFNVEQLSGRLPIPDPEKPDLKKAAAMLQNAGIEIAEGSGVKEYQDAVKKLTVRNAEESGLAQSANTPELLALRYSIASTMAMRKAGIPAGQIEGAPAKSWAASIRHDPSQLSKAARDGSLLGGLVIRDMAASREAGLFRAGQERAEVRKGQELASEVAAVPRGPDSNLLSSGLPGVQESVIAAAQVTALRASAAAGEARAGTNKLAEARNVAKEQLGSGAIVTSAQPGRQYSGKIIGMLGSGPDRTAIQAITDSHAVLHDIRDIPAKSSLRIGDEVSLAADEQGYSMIQGRGPGKNAEKEERAREGLRR